MLPDSAGPTLQCKAALTGGLRKKPVGWLYRRRDGTT
jgi:hypothetical protein